MNINSIETLQARLDKSYAYRKKECDNILGRLSCSNLSEEEIIVYYKSGVVLLYAHWESLVKNVAECYLSYLCSHQKKFQELRPNFLYFTLTKSLGDTGKINLNNYSIFEATQNFFTKPLDQIFCNVPKSLISTRETQNMNAREFECIVKKIGLQYRDEYSLKQQLIDRRLLGQRNQIAHEGIANEKVSDMQETFKILNITIWSILDQLKKDVVFAAQKESYLV